MMKDATRAAGRYLTLAVSLIVSTMMKGRVQKGEGNGLNSGYGRELG